MATPKKKATDAVTKYSTTVGTAKWDSLPNKVKNKLYNEWAAVSKSRKGGEVRAYNRATSGKPGNGLSNPSAKAKKKFK